MSPAAKKLALAGAACLLVAAASRGSKKQKQVEGRRGLKLIEGEAGRADGGQVADIAPAYGVRLGEDIELEDWSEWMDVAPKMLEVTLMEGERDPDVVVANLFRRMYPDLPWPPPPESPMAETYHRMVAFAGRALDRPFKPHFEVVS